MSRDWRNSFEVWCTEPDIIVVCEADWHRGVMTWAYAGEFSDEKEKIVGAVRRAQAALHNLGNTSISSCADELVHVSSAENTCASTRRFAGSLQGCIELSLASARCRKAVHWLYCTTNWACHGKNELQLDRYTQEYIHTAVHAKELDEIRLNFIYNVQHLSSLRLNQTVISTDQAGEVSIGYLQLQSGDCLIPQSGDTIVPQSGHIETYGYDDDDSDDTDEYNVHEVDWGHKVNVRVRSQHPATKWCNALLRWVRCCVEYCIDTLTSLPQIRSIEESRNEESTNQKAKSR
jgi:hypothetical protein